MLIVQKYGGSSVATVERLKIVASRIAESYHDGNQLVIVLSAQGDTTDELLAKAMEITATPSKREVDMLIATGEQQSVALLALTLQELDIPCISFNAQQAAIAATNKYSNARITGIENKNIKEKLAENQVVIVTGFQGINEYGDIATLGRGGSDTSAVAIAAALNADVCEIYTDVDGVYTSDPRIVKEAKKIGSITYDEMLEMASLGASVLHNRSVELAKKNQVKLVVRSSFTTAEGTIVEERSNVEKVLVSGVVVDKDVVAISIVGIVNIPGIAYKIFALLAEEQISIDIIIQSIGRNNTKDIVFTISHKDLADALAILEKNKDIVDCDDIVWDDRVVKLSAIGAGMESNPGVAAKMFEALYKEDININMIATSEIKISVIIDGEDAEKGTKAVHKALIEDVEN